MTTHGWKSGRRGWYRHVATWPGDASVAVIDTASAPRSDSDRHEQRVLWALRLAALVTLVAGLVGVAWAFEHSLVLGVTAVWLVPLVVLAVVMGLDGVLAGGD